MPTGEPAGTRTGAASPGPPEWTLVTDADLALANGVMRDVTTAGPGFVAVGGGWDEALETPVAAIWTSVDGLDWQRVALEGDAMRGQVSAVVSTDQGLIAVGHECCPDRAAVWLSADGIAWQRVPDQEAFTGAAMTGVARWAGGLVAVGCESELECVGMAVWTSSSGDSWERVELHPELAAAFLSDIAVSGSVLVAVGSSDTLAAQPPEILVSLDGQEWARVEAPPAAVALTSVATGPNGIVAAGSSVDDQNGRPVALILTSADGVEWSSVESPAFAGGAVEDIVVSDEGYVAVGRQRRSESGAAATWYALDGETWQRSIPGPAGTMTAVAGDGQGMLVAVGTVEDASASGPAVWVSRGRSLP